MSTVDLLAQTVGRFERADPFGAAELASTAFLARYSGRTLDTYRHDLRTLFQILRRRRTWVCGGDPPAHRALPHRPRTTWAGGVDDRSAPLDSVRFLPVLRTSTAASPRNQPSPSPAPRTCAGRVAAWTVPNSVPSCSPPKTVRPRPCRAGGAARPQRTSRQLGVRDQHRGSRPRARTSQPADRRQGHSRACVRQRAVPGVVHEVRGRNRPIGRFFLPPSLGRGCSRVCVAVRSSHKSGCRWLRVDEAG